ncbi:MAG: DUF5606 domain-containing protein [Flavobacteriaceae bacterium]|nr:DUF5606 domain-containing protein [Flavobacteriaceae bacterium]
MGLDKIISITGKPGLFKVLNQSKNGFVIESLTDGKRTTLIGNQNVSTLKDIAIYTYEEEFPLGLIFKSMFEKEGGKTSINHDAKDADLMAYFEEIVPNFDKERVYPSNVKKVIKWYNQLVDTNFDFSTIQKEEEA